jgi:hypothetical protein
MCFIIDRHAALKTDTHTTEWPSLLSGDRVTTGAHTDLCDSSRYYSACLNFDLTSVHRKLYITHASPPERSASVNTVQQESPQLVRKTAQQADAQYQAML